MLLRKRCFTQQKTPFPADFVHVAVFAAMCIHPLRRVNRMAEGNFGDHKFCRDGVWELRIDQGAGYRVYYAMASGVVVLLLCGGDKGTQDADIERAVVYWKDWQRRSEQ